ncbi:MAG TPA: 23S rRNA (adenine(2503)-C(2))-methyltransferase RlmN [Thermoanaerobaculia bacterium]|nr:23S rRNA (adenine(2503)-C(2))-methyltransferase RlmN [Thermoanaerobaculia bacterium]
MKERVVPNLHDLGAAALAAELSPHVHPSFRIRQIEKWLHDRGAWSFDQMTDLPRELRDSLASRFTLDLAETTERTPPAPDGSEKFLFRLGDGSLVESVFMPMGERTTLCLSSQAGCAVGCTFCVTGFYGAGRNLTPSEIVGQVHRIRLEKDVAWERMNLVFMGMGEPLLNFENLAIALETLERNVSPRRITISTSGIIPGIRELAALERRPNLAVSINAPDQKRREEIMPITKKYPLAELIETLREYPLEKGREMTAEYVLLAGWNDAPDDAAQLARLLRGLDVKVNAIPFNPDPSLPEWMKRPHDAAIDRFAAALVRHRVPVTVRRSRGDQISAACGQLRGKSERRRGA